MLNDCLLEDDQLLLTMDFSFVWQLSIQSIHQKKQLRQLGPFVLMKKVFLPKRDSVQQPYCPILRRYFPEISRWPTSFIILQSMNHRSKSLPYGQSNKNVPLQSQFLLQTHLPVLLSVYMKRHLDSDNRLSAKLPCILTLHWTIAQVPGPMRRSSVIITNWIIHVERITPCFYAW